MLDKPICPRCLGFIPSNLFAGEYPGAISRIDNSTEICSDCGTEEAITALIPISDWPIVFHDHNVTELAKERWQTRKDMISVFKNI